MVFLKKAAFTGFQGFFVRYSGYMTPIFSTIVSFRLSFLEFLFYSSQGPPML